MSQTDKKLCAKIIAETIFSLGKLHERGEIDYDLSKPISSIESYHQERLAELEEQVKKRMEKKLTSLRKTLITKNFI